MQGAEFGMMSGGFDLCSPSCPLLILQSHLGNILDLDFESEKSLQGRVPGPIASEQSPGR